MLLTFKIQPIQNVSKFEKFISANGKHVRCKISSETNFRVRQKGKVITKIKSDEKEEGKKKDKKLAQWTCMKKLHSIDVSTCVIEQNMVVKWIFGFHFSTRPCRVVKVLVSPRILFISKVGFFSIFTRRHRF